MNRGRAERAKAAAAKAAKSKAAAVRARLSKDRQRTKMAAMAAMAAQGALGAGAAQGAPGGAPGGPGPAAAPPPGSRVPGALDDEESQQGRSRRAQGIYDLSPPQLQRHFEKQAAKDLKQWQRGGIAEPGWRKRTPESGGGYRRAGR
jgi:hypothetical protein